MCPVPAPDVCSEKVVCDAWSPSLVVSLSALLGLLVAAGLAGGVEGSSVLSKTLRCGQFCSVGEGLNRLQPWGLTATSYAGDDVWQFGLRPRTCGTVPLLTLTSTRKICLVHVLVQGQWEAVVRPHLQPRCNSAQARSSAARLVRIAPCGEVNGGLLSVCRRNCGGLEGVGGIIPNVPVNGVGPDKNSSHGCCCNNHVDKDSQGCQCPLKVKRH